MRERILTLDDIQRPFENSVDKKKELIDGIHVVKSNLEYIAKTGKINGTLLVEIKRVMEEYCSNSRTTTGSK